MSDPEIANEVEEDAVDDSAAHIVMPPSSEALDAPPSVRFGHLLSQLDRVHKEEVAQLRDEIERLRHGLRPGIAALEVSIKDDPVQPTIDLVESPHYDPPSPIEAHGDLAREVRETTASSLLGMNGRHSTTTNGLDGWFTLKADWLTLPQGSCGTWAHPVDRKQLQRIAAPLQGSPSKGAMDGLDLLEGTSRYVIHPSSNGKTIWDLVGLILISYDMLNIPLQVFNPPKNAFTSGMGYITLVFWTLDIFVSCCSGYYEKGEVVLDNRRIIKKYLTTWFLVDFLVVSPDWIMMMLGGESTVAGYGRVFRAARAVRVLRLLRLAKVVKLLNLVYDMLDSEYAFIIASLVRLLAFILVLNHIIACAWYGIGALGKNMEAHSNWLDDAGSTPVASRDDVLWAYMTSLHWSLTQFTPASMDVSATNVGERFFSVMILFFAMVAFSSVIGSVTTSMAALRNLKGGHMKQFWLMRRYLKQNCVSPELSGRVEKYLDHQLTQNQNTVQLKQIPVLNDVSEQLKIELASEMHNHHLIDHPFFLYLHTNMKMFMYRVCHLVLSQVSFANMDFVFRADDECKMMYFVRSGNFEYKGADGIALDPPLKTSAWLSEAVLWTATWRHRGDFQALAPSELIAVLPGKFSEVMRMHPRPWYFAKAYAHRFVKYIAEIGQSFMTDVFFSEELFQNLGDGDQMYMSFSRPSANFSSGMDNSVVQDLPGATSPWKVSSPSTGYGD